MHLAAPAAALLAIAPSLVAAGGTLGFALGAKQPNGDCKTQADYEEDMKAITADTGSSIVRIYAADQCNTAKEILPAAKAQGFKVVLGIWPTPEESYEKDKAAILEHAPGFEEQVYAVTVGSESLYREDFTGDQLLAKMKDFKASAPQFKIGTADSWNKYQDGTADPVIKEADILLCNAFSYWQGQDINNATGSFFDDIMQAFGHIQSVSGSVDKPELWVGETGWPSAGTKYQAAVPNEENAARFYQEGVCGMIDWGFNVFFFEAFDEPWKPVSIGQDGNEADETHWGAMNADRTEKYSLKC